MLVTAIEQDRYPGRARPCLPLISLGDCHAAPVATPSSGHHHAWTGSGLTKPSGSRSTAVSDATGLLAAGADLFVAGTSVFHRPDRAVAYGELCNA